MLVLVSLLFCATGAQAAFIGLEWDPNPESDIAGYVLYYGTSTGNYTSYVDVGKTTTWTGNALSDGQRYFFAVLAYNTGAVVGAVGGGWLADKLNIKWVTSAFFAVAAVSLTLLGYGAQPLFLIVAVVGASTLGTQILLYAYAGQFYPTSIRSTGLGFASGVGRIGSMPRSFWNGSPGATHASMNVIR